MGNAQGQLKLGKSASFVKTHLQQLQQESDTWEADFRALPTPQGETATQLSSSRLNHWLPGNATQGHADWRVTVG